MAVDYLFGFADVVGTGFRYQIVLWEEQRLDQELAVVLFAANVWLEVLC